MEHARGLHFFGAVDSRCSDLQRKLSKQKASEQLRQMLLLGLTGLGVNEELVRDAAVEQSKSLKSVQPKEGR